MKFFFLELALFVYFISWVGFIFYFKSLEKRAYQVALLVLSIGAGFHSLSLIFLLRTLYTEGEYNFSDALNILSFLLVATFIYFNLARERAYALGTFLLPLPIGLGLLSLLFFKNTQSPFPPVLFKSVWFPIHVFTSLLSHAFLLNGLMSSFLYLLQERELKRKRFGLLFRKLPPLYVLEKISEKALYHGFFFLTLGILSGAIWSELVFGDYWRWSAKEVISLSLWLIYAGMLHQRILIGWRGKRLAYTFILGSFLWFLTFFVVNFYIRGFHTYGF